MAVTREAATRAIQNRQSRDPSKDRALTDADARAVEIEGRRRFFSLRTQWSWVIIAWISILILFNCALAILVGTRLLDFTDLEWFITAVTVETFLQVVALGAIAVRYLFSSGDAPPAA